MLLLLNAINYKKCGGQICGYLKVTGLSTWTADGTYAVLIFLGGGGTINPLNAELNPIYHLLAILGAHHILHISRIRVKQLKDMIL
jgi:hypothetical protein